MGLSRTIQTGLVLMLLQCTQVALAMPFLNESLTYTAVYQGVFSAQQPVAIADVTWNTSGVRLGEMAEPAVETRMTVSSEAYQFVETLYPFRLVYRSLALPDPLRSIAYEKYDSTERHGRDLTWLDEESGVVLRYREGHESKRTAPSQLPVTLRNWGSQQQEYRYYAKARHRALPGMVDRMALLQRIRGEELSVGASYKVPATDGKYRYLYKVGVVTGEALVVAGREFNALKVEFDGYRINDGKKHQNHQPLLVWLDNTPRRTPLRFEYQSVLGRFVIEIQSLDALPARKPAGADPGFVSTDAKPAGSPGNR